MRREKSILIVLLGVVCIIINGNQSVHYSSFPIVKRQEPPAQLEFLI